MAGKRGSCCHSTTSFNESVVVAGTSLLEVLPFSNLERAQRPSITITVLTFLVKNSRMKNSGGLFFDNTRKNCKSNVVVVVVLVRQSESFYYVIRPCDIYGDSR